MYVERFTGIKVRASEVLAMSAVLTIPNSKCATNKPYVCVNTVGLFALSSFSGCLLTITEHRVLLFNEEQIYHTPFQIIKV